MARAAQSPVTGLATEKSHDAFFVQLSQLISRLQQNVLHPTPERERRLRSSEYERAKAEANLDYAMSLLKHLEQDAARMKVPARRLQRQADLHARRETLETLLDRIEDLRQLAMDSDRESDEEDLLCEVMGTPSESDPSTSAGLRQNLADDAPPVSPAPPLASVPVDPAIPAQLDNISPTTPITPAFPVPGLTHGTHTLSSRIPVPNEPPAAADTSHTTARAALFANRREPAAPQTSTATAEAILDQQRAEQDSLSGSILQMARALKASSQRFSSSLEADKDVVGRAGEGIDKTERGMEAARGRMGALRRMTEGKGWWGRMLLYAWVYGLMMTLLLIVFVLPKLRF